jgi:hypothetical protein
VGHSVLEQYQSQIAAALRPAFERETAQPDATIMAVEVLVAFFRYNVSSDPVIFRRLTALLTAPLPEIARTHPSLRLSLSLSLLHFIVCSSQRCDRSSLLLCCGARLNLSPPPMLCRVRQRFTMPGSATSLRRVCGCAWWLPLHIYTILLSHRRPALQNAHPFGQPTPPPSPSSCVLYAPSLLLPLVALLLMGRPFG